MIHLWLVWLGSALWDVEKQQMNKKWRHDGIILSVNQSINFLYRGLETNEHVALYKHYYKNVIDYLNEGFHDHVGGHFYFLADRLALIWKTMFCYI